MTIEDVNTLEPKLQAAAEELAGIIAARYPTAQFRVSRHPEESSTVLLDAIVDVDDTETVFDLVFERMEQLRLDEGIPILVIPLHTPERVARLLQAHAAQHTGSPALL